MDKLTYGDTIEVDFDSLPDVSKFALAQRGLTHVLGNEVASRVHSWAQAEGQANSEDRATVKAWKDANAVAVTDKTNAVVGEMLKALTEGTLGNRISGPRLTPLETLCNQIARREIETILRANKIKVPTGENKVKMPDGEFTMADLIARRLAKESTGPAIRAAAEKELKARAKQLASVEADAAAAIADL